MQDCLSAEKEFVAEGAREMLITGSHRRKLSFSWANVLLENLFLYLMSDQQNVAVGEWRDLKEKMLIQESDKKIWKEVDPNFGPFESPNGDYQNWIKYLHSKGEIIRKRIRDIENCLLLTGLVNAVPLSRETYGKIPEGDNSKGEENTSETPLTKTIRDGFPTIKHHLELLTNWFAYLEDISFNGKTPIETVHRVMSALEGNADYTHPLEIARLNRLLAEALERGNRLTSGKPRSPPTKESLRGGDGDTLREIHRRLSETFLYRNITLAEIKQMSKIVDFVERYRGNLGRVRADSSGQEVESSQM